MNTLIVVLGGVLTSAVLFYFTSSMLLARKQLLAATRLQAYLMHWNQWVLDNGLFPVFNLGREWSEEEHAIIARHGKPEELIELQEEKKKLVVQIQEHIGAEGVEFDREKLIDEIRRLPKESVGSMLDFSKTQRQNLLQGQTFISDEEAAVLGLGITQKAIQLKMGLVDLIDSGTLFAILLVTAPEQFDLKNVSKDIGKMLWRGVVASRDCTSLLRYAQLFTSRTVLELTVRNIRSGSRLSKR